MKLLFIGGINHGNLPRGGEEYKNQLIVRKIINAVIIDTHNWKRNLKIWVKLLIHLFFGSFENIILSTSSLSTYYLLRIVRFVKPSLFKKITYLVIGGYFPEGVRTKRYDWILYSNLKNVIVEGELLKMDLLEQSELENVKVISNFKDFPVLEKLQDPNKSIFSFIYIGRISESKGIKEIIEASKQLQKAGFKFCVDFFGPLEGDFEFTDEFISYKGFLDFQKKGLESYQLISNYHCLLFPTYWHGEGFPGVIIDAFIAGLPVIASDWNMNRELIQNAVNGYLVEPKNAMDLAQKMQIVLENEKELSNIRKFNNSLAKQYHIDNVWPQIEILLQESVIQNVSD